LELHNHLCVFDGDDEIDGVEVGPYADFGGLRDYVVGELEGGQPGTKFPTFVLHSDCDGEWSVDDTAKLLAQTEKIISSRRRASLCHSFQNGKAG
jgi:Immunity protein 70